MYRKSKRQDGGSEKGKYGGKATTGLMDKREIFGLTRHVAYWRHGQGWWAQQPRTTQLKNPATKQPPPRSDNLKICYRSRQSDLGVGRDGEVRGTPLRFLKNKKAKSRCIIYAKHSSRQLDTTQLLSYTQGSGIKTQIKTVWKQRERAVRLPVIGNEATDGSVKGGEQYVSMKQVGEL